jgi:GTPase
VAIDGNYGNPDKKNAGSDSDEGASKEKKDNIFIRSGQKKSVRFRFLSRPEYIKEDTQIVIREGNQTIFIGHVFNVFNLK